MKTSLKRMVFIFMIVVFIFCAASCNFPVKNILNYQTPLATSLATTPPPPAASAQASIPSTPDVGDILPVSGSMMRWIDLSDFVYIPGGEYTIGQNSLAPSDHEPEHQVTLSGFWIHQAEVTNRQYAQCVAAGKCSPPSREEDVPYWYGQASRVNAPVVGVTWYQAQEYCAYIEGRLPSEAEWEAAARGAEAKIYPWGTDEPKCDLLNFNNCLDPSEPDDVRSYNNGASDFEVMELAGNVFEWVADWYDEKYYASSPAENPIGPELGIYKVYRGGSYSSKMEDVNSYVRFSTKPEEHTADLGFRCVLIGEFSDKINQVPRPCELLPENSQPQGQATWTPMPCTSPFIQGNCFRTSNGSQQTSLQISQTGCQINLLDGFSSNTIDNLDCTGPIPIGDTNNYRCTGLNMVQGSTVDISFCHLYSVGMINPECPAGYEYDPYSRFCIPGGPWLPEPPCPINYVEEGGVCFPDITIYQGCPVGFYYALILTGPDSYEEMCYPLDDCLMPNATMPCNPLVCPEGQTYDLVRNCCSNPENLRQICPAGFVSRVDPATQKSFCELPDLYEVTCETKNVLIGYCPTITPTPSATPRLLTCADFTSSSTCIANGCKWSVTAFPGYCY